MLGICKLCQKTGNLRKSHAIPDAFFKKIFDGDSGKAIRMTEEAEDTQWTSDSLGTHQLCDKCEIRLNETYERYSISLLRNQFSNAEKLKEGIQFSDVDIEKFIKFLLAIFWRAANSEHEGYRGAIMPERFIALNGNEKIRKCLYDNSNLPSGMFNFKIQRLHDYSKTWDLKSLKNMLVLPFHDYYGEDKKLSVNFVLEGFYISIIMPSLSNKERKKTIVLYPNGKQFLAKYVDICSIESLKHIIISNGLKLKIASLASNE
jgi:hypothetical protein